MTKKELTKKIKEYVANHKEMQQDEIYAVDLQKCATACKCQIYHVMLVIQYGEVLLNV